MKDYDLELPNPRLVNPERYAAAISAFQGCDIQLDSEDVALFAGTELKDELNELVEFGILSKNDRGKKTVYRPRDNYALSLSNHYKELIFSKYSSITEFLSDENQEIVKGL